MKKKISISSGTLQHKYGDLRALEIIKKSGFDGVDFTVESYGVGGLPDAYNMPPEEFTEYFTRIREKAEEIGLAICQTHNLVNAYTPDTELNKKLLHNCERGLWANELLGCDMTVIHCVSSFQWGFGVPDGQMHEVNQSMYRDILPLAEKHGVTIAPESFGGCMVGGVYGADHFADPEKMLREYDDIGTENKCFCLDTGHTNAATHFGFMGVADYIRLFGSRIKLLHLHDNDGIYDQHLIPRQGNGTVKWHEVFDALEEIGYDGFYNYELGLRFGDSLEKAVNFLGGFLREFTDKNGRL